MNTERIVEELRQRGFLLEILSCVKGETKYCARFWLLQDRTHMYFVYADTIKKATRLAAIAIKEEYPGLDLV